MSRWISTLLALVVGLGVGWLVFRAKKVERTEGQGSVVVYVYGDPKDHDLPHVSIEEATITPSDFVFWVAQSSKKDVIVEFDKEPFQGMTQNPDNNRWRPGNCNGRNCVSGAVKAGPGKYKYWQILHDAGDPKKNRKEKDGWIIIQ